MGVSTVASLVFARAAVRVPALFHSVNQARINSCAARVAGGQFSAQTKVSRHHRPHERLTSLGSADQHEASQHKPMSRDFMIPDPTTLMI